MTRTAPSGWEEVTVPAATTNLEVAAINPVPLSSLSAEVADQTVVREIS